MIARLIALHIDNIIKLNFSQSNTSIRILENLMNLFYHKSLLRRKFWTRTRQSIFNFAWLREFPKRVSTLSVEEHLHYTKWRIIFSSWIVFYMHPLSIGIIKLITQTSPCSNHVWLWEVEYPQVVPLLNMDLYTSKISGK